MILLCLLLAICLHSGTDADSPFVPCEPCDAKVLSMCPPVPVRCQMVKEPGCGCCYTCAFEEGQSCGVYTGQCASGLRCLPKDGEDKPLHALLHGRGQCRNERLYKLMHTSKGSMQPQAKVPISSSGHVDHRKAKAVKMERGRMQQLARLGPHSGRDYTPIDKLQAELGPCRRRLDNLLQSMKDSSRVLALSLHLPNCDKKGFFKRKQCKPSRGRKRGICWCVDRFGVKLPSIDFSGGDIQCKEFDNSSSSNTNE